MGLFGKVEYEKMELPFIYIKEDENQEAGGISLEAYGEVEGVKKYFYFSFIMSDLNMYDKGDYEEMIQNVERIQNRTIIINAKYKKGKLVGFQIEKEDLAKSMNDDRFNHIDILFMSIGNESRKG